MKEFNLKGTERTAVGKKATREIRIYPPQDSQKALIPYQEPDAYNERGSGAGNPLFAGALSTQRLYRPGGDHRPLLGGCGSESAH